MALCLPECIFPVALLQWKAFLGCSGKGQHLQSTVWATAKTPSHSRKQSASSSPALCSNPPLVPWCLHLHTQLRRDVLGSNCGGG